MNTMAEDQISSHGGLYVIQYRNWSRWHTIKVDRHGTRPNPYEPSKPW